MKRNQTVYALYIFAGALVVLAGITLFGFFFNLGIALLAHGFGMDDAGRYMMTPDKALAYFGIILVSCTVALALSGLGHLIEK